LYKLFQSDVADALSSVAFNGRVRIIDPATGRENEPCLIALAAEKSTFIELNLSRIDPVACFNGPGGRISENLDELRAIEAITQ
jgi:restriction system protein